MITGDSPSRIDAALIDRRWRTHWGDRIPSSTRIGSRGGDDVERILVLPGGKRYPSADGEVDQLIDTVLTVMDAALGPPPVILVTHGWRTDAAGTPTRDVFLDDHSPDARFWRTDDLAVEAGFSSRVHSFFHVLRSPRAGSTRHRHLCLRQHRRRVLRRLRDADPRRPAQWLGGDRSSLKRGPGALSLITAPIAHSSASRLNRT